MCIVQYRTVCTVQYSTVRLRLVLLEVPDMKGVEWSDGGRDAIVVHGADVARVQPMKLIKSTGAEMTAGYETQDE